VALSHEHANLLLKTVRNLLDDLQVLWRTLEVHNIVGPMAPSDTNTEKKIEEEVSRTSELLLGTCGLTTWH